MLEVCRASGLFVHEDFSLCAQDLLFAGLSLLFVLFATPCSLRTRRREPLAAQYVQLMKSDHELDDVAVTHISEPQDPSMRSCWYRWWILSLLPTLCYAVLLGVAVQRQSAGTTSLADTHLAIGDGAHLLAWLSGLVLLWAHPPPNVSLWLRLWMLLESCVCVVRLRTDITALVNGGSDSEPMLATVIRVCAGVGVLLATLQSIWQPTRTCNPSFDPMSYFQYNQQEQCYEPKEGAAEVPAEQRVSLEPGCSLWAGLFLSWLNPLLRAGNKVPLENKMLYEMMPADCTAASRQRGREAWARELEAAQAAHRDPSILRMMVKLEWRLILGSGLLWFGATVLQFASPLLLRALLEYMEDENNTRPLSYPLALAGCLTITGWLLAFCMAHCGLLFTRLGQRAWGTLNTLVYAKSLRLTQAARAEFSDGQIKNMMAIDAQRISDSAWMLHEMWSIPGMLVVCTLLLYNAIGAAAFTGFGVMALLLPFNMYIARNWETLDQSIQESRDVRVKLLREVLNGIKIVKSLGWEPLLRAKLERTREDELKVVGAIQHLFAKIGLLFELCPMLMKVASISVYVLMGNNLTASTAFYVIPILDMLVEPVQMVGIVAQLAIGIKVSMDRLTRFLCAEEAAELPAWDDILSEPPAESPSREPPTGHLRLPTQHNGVDGQMVRIEGGSFRWREGKAAKEEKKEAKEVDLKELEDSLAKADDVANKVQIGTRIDGLKAEIASLQAEIEACGEAKLLPKRGPPTLSGVELSIQQGGLTCVVGSVGSGKSSLLSAILNEIELEAGHVLLCGSVAYCAQEPWIFQGTVRDNVLFKQPMEQARYQRALSACALGQDLATLSGGKGDLTEIGEKGLNLSGGQKARIALARAVYADADVYLLDDIISAVDAEVAKHIMEECVLGVLRPKTVVLVTNQCNWLEECSLTAHGQIVVLGNPLKNDAGGHIAHTGSFAELQAKGCNLLEVLAKDDEAPSQLARVGSNSSTVSAVSAAGGEDSPELALSMEVVDNVAEEDVQTGAVALAVWCLYLRLLGTWNLWMLIPLYCISQAGQVSSSYVMNVWTNHVQNQTDDQSQTSKLEYIGLYGGIQMGCAVLLFVRISVYVNASVQVSKRIHENALWSLLRAPMSYFDTTIKGRIENRFSNDLQKVDMELRGNMSAFFATAVLLGYSLISTMTVAPYIIAAMIPLTTIYVMIMQFFRSSFRELQRLRSVGTSPVFAGFEEALCGVGSIRAYGAVEPMEARNVQVLATAQRPSYLQDACTEWLNIRLQVLGAILTGGTAVTLLWMYGHDPSKASIMGFALSQSMTVTTILSNIISLFTQCETSLIAMERLHAFSDPSVVPSEPPLRKDSDNALEVWPAQGCIEFHDVSFRYRPGLDTVLKGLSFTVQPGQRVGIVGRTGSGKSTVLMALFRLAELCGGQIKIDDVNIADVGLTSLRTRLSIIPQDPVLFSGTLLSNLDPNKEYSQEELWDVLDSVSLKQFVQSRDGGLEMILEPNGENLSLGQRQLLCLARAMLRRSKVLVLDEATASVDKTTDALIQSTLSKLVGVTMLTIAHRLDTIMNYDRVLVLDGGRVAEYDNPLVLCQRKKSAFAKMWSQYQAEAASES